MSADRDDPLKFLAPSAPWLVEALGSGAPAPAIGHHIGGQSEPGGTRSSPLYNPATGATIGKALLADAMTVNRAVAAAKAALPGWAP